MIMTAVQQGPWWCPMCPGHHAWGWGMWFWMVLFWVAVIVLVVWLIRRFTADHRRPPQTADDAQETLRKRYARGDIDSETYNRMLDDLRKK
ncbi:MAG TPA: hypothetical protein VMN39_03885 [Longimicrobiaceae bacterium]|nr:hypothetical protein [Longimicrobiaceae bacterium]